MGGKAWGIDYLEAMGDHDTMGGKAWGIDYLEAMGDHDTMGNHDTMGATACNHWLPGNKR